MPWLTSLIETYGLAGLFLNIFLSYSILPTFTEIPIVISLNFFSPVSIFLVAIIAATLGSITNYYIGLKGIRRFMPKEKNLQKADNFFRRWGPIALVFLTWLPFVGDPLFVVAGTLKMKFWKFLLYSTIAKVWYFLILIFFGGLLF